MSDENKRDEMAATTVIEDETVSTQVGIGESEIESEGEGEDGAQHGDDIISGIEALVARINKMLHAVEQEAAETDAEKAPTTEQLELRFKLFKLVVMQVDNSMGDFHDLLDTMDYNQDKDYERARMLINELEDRTNDLIAYLRKHGKY